MLSCAGHEHLVPSEPSIADAGHVSHQAAELADETSDATAQLTRWDTELHSPLWLSATEHAQIAARLPSFVASALAVAPQLSALAARLRKPLRPLWVSQESRIWTNHVASPHELSFCPVILISASAPELYQRRTVTRALAPRALLTAAVSDGSDSDSDSDAPPATQSFNFVCASVGLVADASLHGSH